MNLTDRPLAAPGLISYRCKNRFGWTMIGARDDADALKQARRTWSGSRVEDLERWDGKQYVKVQPSSTWVPAKWTKRDPPEWF